MKNEINAVLENMTTVTPEPEDYTGEDGLLYCGKCRKPKEAYCAPDKAAIFGRDRHPAECDCQRAAREEREAAEKRRRHLDTVEELKRRGFTDPTMRDWTFENDNGRNPQAGIARRYVEHWEDMRADNIGCLFWGGVGTGKSYLAGCIANALMEKEIPVHMTNFALILNDLAASFENRNEYISRLCRYPLLILDDFGMERGTEYGLEQVFNVIDSRYRSGKPHPNHFVRQSKRFGNLPVGVAHRQKAKRITVHRFHLSNQFCQMLDVIGADCCIIRHRGAIWCVRDFFQQFFPAFAKHIVCTTSTTTNEISGEFVTVFSMNFRKIFRNV